MDGIEYLENSLIAEAALTFPAMDPSEPSDEILLLFPRIVVALCALLPFSSAHVNHFMQPCCALPSLSAPWSTTLYPQCLWSLLHAPFFNPSLQQAFLKSPAAGSSRLLSSHGFHGARSERP